MAEPALATRESLLDDLRALGLAPGSVVMVHTSLRALGPVGGGAQTVIDALLDTVGADGTVMMPAQSWQLADPAFLGVEPEEDWPRLRDERPVYDPATTPSRTMGAVAELFRTQPGARRSPHPHRSVAAVGPAADALTATQPLDGSAGEESPLARLVELDGCVLLLGTTAASATVLHLAEERAASPVPRRVTNGAALVVDGRRTWATWTEPEHLDHDFEAVAEAFERDTGLARRGRVASASATLLPARALVEYATEWFRTHR